MPTIPRIHRLRMPRDLDDLPPRLLRHAYRAFAFLTVLCGLLFVIAVSRPPTGSALVPLLRTLVAWRWLLLGAVPLLLLAFASCRLIYSLIEGGPWVTQRVRATRRRLEGQSVVGFAQQQFSNGLKHGLDAFTLPSGLGLILSAIPAALFLIPLSLAPHPGPASHDQYLALWQVHAGLAVAALPLLVVVIELSRDDPALAQRRFAVLVRNTYAFPISVFVVAAVFVSALGGFWLWSSWSPTIGLILFTLSLGATVFPFLQLLRLHSDRARLEDRSRALLAERFQRSLDHTTDGRIAAFVMQDWLDGTVAKYSFLSPKRGRYQSLDSWAVSYVVDVDLKQLDEFVRSLPPETAAPGADATRLMGKPTAAGTTSGPKLVLTRLVGDQTFEADAALAFIKTELLRGENLEELRARFLRCYKLEDALPDAPAALERYLEELRTSLVHAIRAQDTVAVRRGCSVYITLIEAFLRHLQSLGIRYGRKESEQETNAFLTGRSWKEVQWLHESYVELLREAFAKPQPDVLLHLLYFPYSVATRALSARDFYTIHQFLLGAASLPYLLHGKLSDPETRGLAMDRLHRHPVEFVQFGVRPWLETATPADSQFLVDVLEGLVTVLNDRLKAAFDATDLDGFVAFIKALQTTVSEMEKDEIPHDLELNPALRMRRLADLSRFGMYSWIASAYLRGDMAVETVNEWLDACGDFGGIEGLLQTYAHALKYDLQEVLKWLHWEVEGREAAGFVDSESRLHDGFLIQLLRRCEDPSGQNQLPSDADLSRTLGRVAAEGGAAWRALEELDWSGVAPLLGRDPELCRMNVEELLRTVHRDWSSRWSDVVATASIDETKRSQFRANVVQGFQEGSPLRWLLNQAGRIEVVIEADHDARRAEWRGFNHLMPKEDFVSSSTTITELYATDLGRQLAREGEERVVQQLVNGAARHRDLKTEDYSDVLLEEAQLLTKRGYVPSIVLVGRWGYFRDLASRLEWGRREGTKPTGYMGKLESVDFYELHARRTVGALVMDVSRALTWRNYHPPPDTLTDGLESPIPSLTFGLNEVDLEALRDAMREHPEEWLRENEHGDVETPEQALVRLKQKVQFRAFTRVDCKVDDRSAVVFLSAHEIRGKNAESS